jgi:hypothetical protein
MTMTTIEVLAGLLVRLNKLLLSPVPYRSDATYVFVNIHYDKYVSFSRSRYSSNGALVLLYLLLALNGIWHLLRR